MAFPSRNSFSNLPYIPSKIASDVFLKWTDFSLIEMSINASKNLVMTVLVEA